MMESSSSSKAFERSASVATLLALAVALVMIPQAAYGQATTVPCSAAMLSSFTPCLNFLANSTSNGTSSPTSDCCSSLKGILSNGTDCFCQIGTGTVRVPFRIPINRTLVMSLPKACKMGGVPLKCQSAATPIPAPGPTAFSPVVQSPAAAPAFGGTTSAPASGSPAAQGPVSDTTPSSTGTSLPPTTTSTGGSSTLNPTSSGGASRSYTTASLLLPVSLAAVFFKYCC